MFFLLSAFLNFSIFFLCSFSTAFILYLVSPSFLFHFLLFLFPAFPLCPGDYFMSFSSFTLVISWFLCPFPLEINSCPSLPFIYSFPAFSFLPFHYSFPAFPVFTSSQPHPQVNLKDYFPIYFFLSIVNFSQCLKCKKNFVFFIRV